MRILGIDPGSRLTGFGVVQVLSNGKIGYVASGVIRVPAVDLAARLKVIYEGVSEVIARYRPEVAAVEKVFMARNADSALKLGQARAAALLAAANCELAVSEYTALQVKQALVGKGHAQKEQVKHMVKVLLELSGNPQADAADALACAVCHAHHAHSARRAGGLSPRYRVRRSLRALRVAP
jgi:crossover junction endodeoxyribonuclease RuvC